MNYMPQNCWTPLEHDWRRYLLSNNGEQKSERPAKWGADDDLSRVWYCAKAYSGSLKLFRLEIMPSRREFTRRQ